ncbi:MAG: hypothetical protein ACW98F_04205, partial [Candidatus Hodarchaeales archaeon]
MVSIFAIKPRNRILNLVCVIFFLIIFFIPLFSSSRALSELTFEHIHSKLLGNRQDEEIYDITRGASGFIYVLGHTNSFDFNSTPSVYDESYNGK